MGTGATGPGRIRADGIDLLATELDRFEQLSGDVADRLDIMFQTRVKAVFPSLT